MSSNLEAYFAPQGVLASHTQGYQLRQGQVELAHAIESTITRTSVLLAEAGTGTGKTLAYLLPALLSRETVVISTATKALQEQIFRKDIPLLRKVLGRIRVELIKGRQNYICNLRCEQFLEGTITQYHPYIRDIYQRSRDGDIAELKALPEKSPIFAQITSTRESCLGRDCPLFSECFVQKIRKRAKEADVVIINHHILLSDLARQANILPEASTMIIDEAHHLPHLTPMFLGKRLSTRQLRVLIDDFLDIFRDKAQDASALFTQSEHCKQALIHLEDEVKKLQVGSYTQETWKDLPDLWQHIMQVAQHFLDLETALEAQEGRDSKLQMTLLSLNDVNRQLVSFLECYQKIGQQEAMDKKQASWIEIYNDHRLLLQSVDLNAARRFRQWTREKDSAWVFLSATLTTNGNFDYFSRELGLDPQEVQTIMVPSPFDYQRQSLMFLPNMQATPNQEVYSTQLLNQVLPIIEATQGRAFLLFTSYAAMYKARDFLRDRDFHLLIQGDMGKVQLLEQFQRLDRALLLATNSFWEGIDVKGDKLVCVMIDKLPFPSYGDPFSMKRREYLEAEGLSSFVHDGLPQAIIRLKQGAGRLIRDTNDYGVLVIGDPRLRTQKYGQQFLSSLPHMPITSDLMTVKEFLNRYES